MDSDEERIATDNDIKHLAKLINLEYLFMRGPFGTIEDITSKSLIKLTINLKNLHTLKLSNLDVISRLQDTFTN